MSLAGPPCPRLFLCHTGQPHKSAAREPAGAEPGTFAPSHSTRSSILSQQCSPGAIKCRKAGRAWQEHVCWRVQTGRAGADTQSCRAGAIPPSAPAQPRAEALSQASAGCAWCRQCRAPVLHQERLNRKTCHGSPCPSSSSCLIWAPPLRKTLRTCFPSLSRGRAAVDGPRDVSGDSVAHAQGVTVSQSSGSALHQTPAEPLGTPGSPGNVCTAQEQPSPDPASASVQTSCSPMGRARPGRAWSGHESRQGAGRGSCSHPSQSLRSLLPYQVCSRLMPSSQVRAEAVQALGTLTRWTFI